MVVLAACGEDAAAPGPSPTPAIEGAAEAGGLVVVLPPAEGLAEPERARMRLLVGRALEAVLPAAAVAATPLLEPADRSSLVDTVERAARRVGPGGTVCVLGADVAALIAPVFTLYPAVRPCLLPHAAAEDDRRFALDVDVEALGRALGAAARTAAGNGTVIALDGQDPMLDRRWRAGVLAGALRDGVVTGAVHSVRSADELLALLAEQDALVAEGTVPGSAGALPEVDVGPELPFRDDLPAARALPPVAVVVLDASTEAARLVGPLAERGILLIAPRSLLLAAEAAEVEATPADAVVLRWRVRWDVPLAELLRRVMAGVEGSPTTFGAAEDAFILELGPAQGAS